MSHSMFSCHQELKHVIPYSAVQKFEALEMFRSILIQILIPLGNLGLHEETLRRLKSTELWQILQDICNNLPDGYHEKLHVY